MDLSIFDLFWVVIYGRMDLGLSLKYLMCGKYIIGSE